MPGERLCILGAAPQEVVEQCLTCIDREADAIYFLEQGAQFISKPAPERCLDFTGAINQDDPLLRKAFVTFRPTDVVLVCQRYNHDKVVDAVVAWSEAANIAPRIHVYQNHILHEGYLEVICKHPRLKQLGRRG